MNEHLLTDKYLQPVLVFDRLEELATMKRLGRLGTTDKDLAFLKMEKCILLVYTVSDIVQWFRSNTRFPFFGNKQNSNCVQVSTLHVLLGSSRKG